MATLIVAGMLLIYIWAIENDKSNHILAIAFGITMTYFYRYSLHKNFTSEQLLKYALYGQNLYALLYVAWLSFFPKSTYVFYVPIFFSSITKTIWLFTSKDQLNVDFLEEASLFQTKTEIFVIGYSFLSIIYGGLPVLTQIFFLILIIKLKYSFHGKAQQAFKELHFVIDNILKRTKLRSNYQRFVHILGFIGQVHGGSKEIIY